MSDWNELMAEFAKGCTLTEQGIQNLRIACGNALAENERLTKRVADLDIKVREKSAQIERFRATIDTEKFFMDRRTKQNEEGSM